MSRWHEQGQAAWRRVRVLLAIGAGLLSFAVWIGVVGPQVHIQETYIGLVLAFGSAFAVLYLTKRPGRSPSQASLDGSGDTKRRSR